MDLAKIIPDDCQNIVLMLVGILVVVIVYFVYNHKRVPSKSDETVTEDKKVKFKDSEKQSAGTSAIVMYGKDSCPWCKRQKTELGDMWDKVEYVNCASEGSVCEEKEISALPTWVINGERSEGFMKKDEFSKKCGL